MKMAETNSIPMVEPSIDTDKLSYEIFSILESNFLFGYDAADQKLWPLPKQTSDPKTQRGKICLLSVDGAAAATPSILSGKTLSSLEAALKAKSGDPDARIADYFDVAAGTGVGGIFAAMLFASADPGGRPIFRADETLKLVAAEGARRRPRRFLKRVLGNKSSGGGGLEKAVREAFRDGRSGRSLTLKDTVKPVLIPCYDLSTAAPFLFSRADALETDSYDFNLWEVCLATSAQAVAPGGPVCMRSVDGSTRCVGVDGGLAMSNPTAAAITHVLHNKQEFPFVRGVEDILVLSVGAGGEAGSFDFDRVKKWTAKDWAGPLARISADGSAETVDHAVAMAFAHSRSSSNYVRIQANGSGSGRCKTGMMERAEEMLKEKNVESVMFNGKRIAEESNMEKIEWFAEQLVVEHQKRSSRIAPTVAFKQPQPPSKQH